MSKLNYHSAHFKDDSNRTVLWKVLSGYLSNYFQQDDRVLELGAGYCYWINSINSSNKVAVDVWPDFSKHADSNITTMVHDLSKGLPKVDALFDTIISSNLLEHIDYDSTQVLIKDIFKNIKSGGRLILIQPNFKYAYKSYFDDYTHKTIYTDISLAGLLIASGFEIEKLEKKFTPYSMIGLRFQIPSFFIKIYLRSPFKPFAGQMLVVARKP